MKKKLCLGLLFTSFACLTLASCNNGFESTASKEVDTSKDFDLEKPEPLSSAKLLSQDEKVEYISKNSNPDLDAIYANAKNKYNTMVLLYKYKRVETKDNNEILKQGCSKTVVDLKNGNAWYYEKYNVESPEEKISSFELETKVVNKEGNYIIRSTMDLNNYVYAPSFSQKPTYLVTGKSNLYTSISSNGLVLNFENRHIRNRIDTLAGTIARCEDEAYNLYVDESNSYTYYKTENGMAYDITITADNFYGHYRNTYPDKVVEVAEEVYFSDKSIINDEIDTTDYKEYSIDDWNMSYDYNLPLFRFDNSVIVLWYNTTNTSLTLQSFYKKFFTVTKK